MRPASGTSSAKSWYVRLIAFELSFRLSFMSDMILATDRRESRASPPDVEGRGVRRLVARTQRRTTR
jgi:hypothetical protein